MRMAAAALTICLGLGGERRVGAGLSMRPGEAGGALPGRRRDRCRHARGGRAARSRVQKDLLCRKPRRRDRQHRHGRGGHGTAGRLYAPGQRNGHRDLPDELQQASLRPVQGSGAGRRLRRHADADRRGHLRAGERHQGPGRVEQDQTRGAQLQHRGLRPAAASRQRGNRAAHGRQVHPRRLSRRRHRDERPGRRRVSILAASSPAPPSR